ncbi:COMM domain-containing protein 5-like [Dendronephthya gigantea]|uniref:COMM domain-containing protein 5-like n=1 Tax=Dendronephthya gigantea TaxID=151771 RepID=UPI00106BCE2C|nr:COMM domain-containing protein 5-like [Dendronephthya gigantea]
MAAPPPTRDRTGTLSSNPAFQGDSILFHGYKIPTEVRKMVPYLTSLKVEKFKKLLEVVQHSLENYEVDQDILCSLRDKNISEESVLQIFSGLHKIMKATLRQTLTSIKQENYKAELLSYKIPENFVNEIMVNVFKSHTRVETGVLSNRIRLPGLQSLKWRVDVTISTSSLNRVLVPTVFMEVKTSDGSIKSFEVPLSRFNELEYDVAYVLKEMEDLEKRNILKIED